MILKRKIYDKLLSLKKTLNGKHTAVYDDLFVKTAARTITRAAFFISLYVTSTISLIGL